MSSSKQTSRLWILKLAGLLLIPLLALVGVDHIYRQQYELPYPWPHNVLPNPPRSEPYQVVKVGNSHSQDGITFEGFRTETLSLSGVAQRFETDLAVLKQHRAEIADGAVIIIPVTPISFSHTSVNSQRGFQSGYYGRVSPFFIPNLNWGDYLESEFLPFVRAGFNWRKRYDDALQAEISAAERWVEPSPTPSPVPSLQPTAKTAATLQKVRRLRFSEDKMFLNVAAIEEELASPSAISTSRDNTDFMYNKWLKTDEFETASFDDNRRDLEKLISYSLSNNWQPVLISIPVSNHFIEALPDDYMKVYVYDQLELVNTQGVEHLDFQKSSPLANDKRYFANVDHLSPTGSKIFSYFLLQELIKGGYLDKSIDGYDYGPLYEEVWVTQ